MRINKFLSANGYCSRREADRLIEAGRVFINGKRAKLGDQVMERDEVRVEGRSKQQRPKPLYLMLNKPVGVIVTSDRRKKQTVLDLLNIEERVFPVGRLDVMSEGLLLLTNDGTLANRLMHPRYEHEKEYVVEVDRALETADIRKLQNGVRLDDGMTLPAKVRKMDRMRFAIILREGRNRQIRRMCEALGYRVVRLTRTRILSLKMPSTYPSGSWRFLTPSETRDLKRAVGLETSKNL
ncbi:rRNA pseudouridine synthase [Candidatus Parcubacteria bacterium]|nr:rRNA pseudouridine synthase [Candidatus Parcubacteria bacterium]